MLRRKLSPRTTLAAVAAVALLGPIAGCGEKEEPDTTGPVVGTSTTSTTTGGSGTGQTDQQLASTAAEDFLTIPGPTVCDSGVTEALLRSSYGDRAGCVAARTEQSLAQTVQLSGIEVGQGTATLTADARGGTFGTGQKLEMTVVRDGTGTWRVDQVRSNVPVGP